MPRILDNETSSKNEEEVLRKSLASLDVQRKSMEQEADVIYLELTTPPSEGVEPMGVDTPMIDQEGYPRGDIDVYRARSLRQRFRVLQTDHKALARNIEGMLLQLAAYKNPQKILEEQKEQALRSAPKPKPKYDPITGKWAVMNWDGTAAGLVGQPTRAFDSLSEAVAVDRQVSGLTTEESSPLSSLANSSRSHTNEPHPPTQQQQQDDEHNIERKSPFARIDAVASGSPADVAGLREEDLILQFGDDLPIPDETHNHLKAIAELVPLVGAEQGSIPVRLMRRIALHESSSAPPTDRWTTLTIQLRPRPWIGRGLLGCHIVPYQP